MTRVVVQVGNTGYEVITILHSAENVYKKREGHLYERVASRDTATRGFPY